MCHVIYNYSFCSVCNRQLDECIWDFIVQEQKKIVNFQRTRAVVFFLTDFLFCPCVVLIKLWTCYWFCFLFQQEARKNSMSIGYQRKLNSQRRLSALFFIFCTIFCMCRCHRHLMSFPEQWHFEIAHHYLVAYYRPATVFDFSQ